MQRFPRAVRMQDSSHLPYEIAGLALGPNRSPLIVYLPSNNRRQMFHLLPQEI
jgi:hypothetical protein